MSRLTYLDSNYGFFNLIDPETPVEVVINTLGEYEENEGKFTQSLSFGELIRNTRRASNMNQRNLATKLRISQSAISQIENGTLKPYAAMIPIISGILEIPVKVLVMAYKKSFNPNGQNDLGSIIKHDRELLGFTIDELAELTDISAYRLKQFENGLMTPNFQESGKLCRALISNRSFSKLAQLFSDS